MFAFLKLFAYIAAKRGAITPAQNSKLNQNMRKIGLFTWFCKKPFRYVFATRICDGIWKIEEGYIYEKDIVNECVNVAKIEEEI